MLIMKVVTDVLEPANRPIEFVLVDLVSYKLLYIPLEK